MQIEIQIDEKYDDLKVLILTNKITDEVNENFSISCQKLTRSPWWGLQKIV